MKDYNSEIDQDYHTDADLRENNISARGIVIKNGKILLMHRIRNGKEYYVIPGVHKQSTEKIEETVVREIYEETGIQVKNIKLSHEFKDHVLDEEAYVFLCECDEFKEPFLNGEEALKSSQENFYEPMWVDLDKLENLTIYPDFIAGFVKENEELRK